MHCLPRHAEPSGALRPMASPPGAGGGMLSGGLYLALHEFGVTLVDLHLLEVIMPVVGVQRAARLQHLHLVLQVPDVPLQRGDLGALRAGRQVEQQSDGGGGGNTAGDPQFRAFCVTDGLRYGFCASGD